MFRGNAGLLVFVHGNVIDCAVVIVLHPKLAEMFKSYPLKTGLCLSPTDIQ